MTAALVAVVFVLSHAYGWTVNAVNGALLGVCAFVVWWDWAVIGRRVVGPLVAFAVLAAGFAWTLWAGP